jgi:hypothetical protein
MRHPNTTLAVMDRASLAGCTRATPRLTYDRSDYGLPRDTAPCAQPYRWHTIQRLHRRTIGGTDRRDYWQAWGRSGPLMEPSPDRLDAIDRAEGGPVDAGRLAAITECRAGMELADENGRRFRAEQARLARPQGVLDAETARQLVTLVRRLRAEQPTEPGNA